MVICRSLTKELTTRKSTLFMLDFTRIANTFFARNTFSLRVEQNTINEMTISFELTPLHNYKRRYDKCHLLVLVLLTKYYTRVTM